MLIRTNNAVLALVLMLVSGLASAGADLGAGRLRFSVCGACHGLQGQGNEELRAPRIAGLPSWYTARQLQSFASGTRGGPESDKTSRQMAIFALKLTVDEIVNLSAYLETLPGPENLHGESASQDIQEAGQAAYERCSSCHGPNAEGSETLGAPPLRGLNAWYFKKQMSDFQSGIRGYEAADTFGASMRAIAQSIETKETADAISAYLYHIDR